MNRWKRQVNVTLLALSVMATATGWWALGTGSTTLAKIIITAHGVSGIALLVLFPAKSRIAKWGLRSAGRSRKVIGFALAALVLSTVAGGLLHAVGGWRTYLGLLPMQWHVGAATAAGVLLIGHVLIHHRIRWRRWRPLLRRTDLDRRAALGAAGIAAGAAALWPPGRSIDVVSATGYRRRFPASEAAVLLLATHAAGDPLSAGHGGPARLVAPGRRGFWWVKWVTGIDVVDAPAWRQPPFPLS